MAEQDAHAGTDRNDAVGRQYQERDRGVDRQQNQQDRNQGAVPEPENTADTEQSGAGYGNHGEGGQGAEQNPQDASRDTDRT